MLRGRRHVTSSLRSARLRECAYVILSQINVSSRVSGDTGADRTPLVGPPIKGVSKHTLSNKKLAGLNGRERHVSQIT